MNTLKPEKQVTAIKMLTEGNSIRSTERMTGIHRDTIMRLAVRVGTTCEAILDETMRGLRSSRLQLDEIWCYVAKKQKHVRPEEDNTRVGDFWTFVAIDADTKLIPSFLVGKRNQISADAFLHDLAPRLTNRVQISTDALDLYVNAVESAFGGDVDYGRIVKQYEAVPSGAGRYSPAKIVSVYREAILGSPDEAHISTSYVERQNLTMRMHIRRMTRLTNGFSKKPENLRAAVALHMAYYNLVLIHGSLRVTPAMEAGVTRRLWTVEDLVALSV